MNTPFAAQFEAYFKACWPQGCPPLQRREIQQAFYAGALSFLRSLHENANNDSASQQLSEEVESFNSDKAYAAKARN